MLCIVVIYVFATLVNTEHCDKVHACNVSVVGLVCARRNLSVLLVKEAWNAHLHVAPVPSVIEFQNAPLLLYEGTSPGICVFEWQTSSNNFVKDESHAEDVDGLSHGLCDKQAHTADQTCCEWLRMLRCMFDTCKVRFDVLRLRITVRANQHAFHIKHGHHCGGNWLDGCTIVGGTETKL